MSKLPAIDCSTCKTEKSMIATSIYRFSQIVVLIGFLIIIPSILGMILGGMTCFSSVTATQEVMTQATSDAEQAGAALAGTMGAGISTFIIVSSLIGGLLGYLLIMRKKVFKCSACGFILNRD